MTAAPVRFPFVEAVHEETLTLLIKALVYCEFKLPPEIAPLEPIDRLRIVGHAYRVTSRLAWATAWVAFHRAVLAGETITEDQRPTIEARWAGVWIGSHNLADLNVPGELQSLLDRSRGLVLRVLRIDSACHLRHGTADPPDHSGPRLWH